MELISIFFILMSIIVLAYLILNFHSFNRFPIFIEIFYVGIYVLVLIIFLFPNSLRLIEEIFGVQSAINFVIYLSIFVIYFLFFILYQKQEKQRSDITKLTREIAYLKNKNNKNSQKNKNKNKN